MSPMLAATISIIATIAVTPVVIRMMRTWRVIDTPNHRSSHTRNTPRGGGLGLAIVAIAVVTAWGELDQGLGVAVATVALFALLGFADDLRSLPSSLRLGIQLVLSAIAVVGIVDSFYPFALLLPFLIVAVVNAFNFMDGINGISGVTMAVAGGYFAVIGVWESTQVLSIIGAALLGTGLGFLPFNVPNARIFLGDVGSYFAGSLIGVAAVVAYEMTSIGIVAAMAPVIIYASDTAFTMLRRIRRGDSWLEPHREHVYQRVTTGRRTHTFTSTVVAAFSLVTCSIAAIAHRLDWPWPIAAVILAMVGAAYLSLPAILGTADEPLTLKSPVPPHRRIHHRE